MTNVDVDVLLDDLDTTSRDELGNVPEVVDSGYELDIEDLCIVARKWHKVKDVVCVVADLKNSTRLGLNKHATSTARIYQASTDCVVRIFNTFEADFIQIQGDGVFALFWGDYRKERAMCAGITVKSFSRDLVERLVKKWPELPETGYKVGIARSQVLVKKIGTPRNPAEQEPIWAGKVVNFATKCAQMADKDELIVTGSFWDWVEPNDYLTYSCPCREGGPAPLWENVEIEKIPESDYDRQGRKLRSTWCEVHGNDYCNAVMDGKKNREDVATKLREQMMESMSRSQVWTEARNKRRQAADAQRGGLRR